MQGNDIYAVGLTKVITQSVYFGRSGQEHEHVAFCFTQRGANGASHERGVEAGSERRDCHGSIARFHLEVPPG